MDVINLTTETKEEIDLDNMSPRQMMHIVKYLYHKVQSLSADLNIEKLKGNSIGYWGSTQPVPV